MSENHTEDIIDCMARMKGDNQPFALATVVRTEDATAAKAGNKAVIRADGSMVGWLGGGCTIAATKKTAARALADGRARLISVRPAGRLDDDAATDEFELHQNNCPSGGTIDVFIEPVLPRASLVVAGASPVARALAELGRGVGFAITVAALSDDQSSFPNADFRIEGFDFSAPPAGRTESIIVATQGKRDREALRAALSSDAGYVGFVGSRRKAETLKAGLREDGIADDRIAELRSPAGLDIGAATPEEIALSILAEIVVHRRGATTAPEVEVEEIEGGSFESRVVSPVLGACEGEDGKH
ncbi:MAG TPA: XdhC/CoxI family protein [Alphaproteobacteria bacterium]|nr:XdhC/CoxI family protein [Alphaproteobacteria bacterium]